MVVNREYLRRRWRHLLIFCTRGVDREIPSFRGGGGSRIENRESKITENRKSRIDNFCFVSRALLMTNRPWTEGGPRSVVCGLLYSKLRTNLRLHFYLPERYWLFRLAPHVGGCGFHHDIGVHFHIGLREVVVANH
jgi:hypothetical protein